MEGEGAVCLCAQRQLRSALAGGEHALVKMTMATHAGTTTEEFEKIVTDWLATAKHPKTGRLYTEIVYQPMLEVLSYLRANGSKTFIVSGGGIEFMRPWTEKVYGIPREQVIGSSIKTKYELRDGRRELLSNEQGYDLITLEPPPPSAAGVANLYSSDFYTLAHAGLRPNGFVAQWLPLPTQNDVDTRSLVRSFLYVFPYATMWTTELHEMLLVGSLERIDLDVPRIVERFSRPGGGFRLA